MLGKKTREFHAHIEWPDLGFGCEWALLYIDFWFKFIDILKMNSNELVYACGFFQNHSVWHKSSYTLLETVIYYTKITLASWR